MLELKISQSSRKKSVSDSSGGPRTKNLKLHNLVADYFAQVLVRGKQGY